VLPGVTHAAWYQVAPGFQYPCPDRNSELFRQTAPTGAKSTSSPLAKFDSLTTAELVTAGLECVDTDQIWAYNNGNETEIDWLGDNFNGLTALIARPDAPPILADLYCRSDADQVHNYDEQGIFRFQFLELIIAQYPVLHNAGETVRAKIFQCATQRDSQTTSPDLSLTSRMTAMLAGRIALMDWPETLQESDGPIGIRRMLSHLNHMDAAGQRLIKWVDRLSQNTTLVLN
jgi:hypothetical protein